MELFKKNEAESDVVGAVIEAVFVYGVKSAVAKTTIDILDNIVPAAGSLGTKICYGVSGVMIGEAVGRAVEPVAHEWAEGICTAGKQLGNMINLVHNDDQNKDA